MTFTEKTSTELELKLDLKTVSAQARKKWEEEVSHSFEESETIRRNIKVNGSKTPKLKVVWVGVFRKGTANVSSGEERKSIPFLIQVGLKPVLKVIRD